MDPSDSQEDKLLNPQEDLSLSPDLRLTDAERKQMAVFATGLFSGSAENEGKSDANVTHSRVNKPTNKILMKQSKLDKVKTTTKQQQSAIVNTDGATSTSFTKQIVNESDVVYTGQLSGAGTSSTVIDSNYMKQDTNIECHNTKTSESSDVVINTGNKLNEASGSDPEQTGIEVSSKSDAMNDGVVKSSTVKHSQPPMLHFIDTSQSDILPDDDVPVPPNAHGKKRKQRPGGKIYHERKANAKFYEDGNFDVSHAHAGVQTISDDANINHDQNRIQFSVAAGEYAQQFRTNEWVQRNGWRMNNGSLYAQHGPQVGHYTGAGFSNPNPNFNPNAIVLNPSVRKFLPHSFTNRTVGEMMNTTAYEQPGHTGSGAMHPNLRHHYNQMSSAMPKHARQLHGQNQVTPEKTPSGRGRTTHYKALTPMQRLQNIKKFGATYAPNQGVGNMQDNKRSRVQGDTPRDFAQNKKRARTLTRAESDTNLLVAIADMPMPGFIAPMTKVKYDSLYKAINNLLFQDLEKGNAMPIFAENHLTRGVMKISCSTPATKHWLQCAIVYLPRLWNDMKIVAINFDDIPNPKKILSFFPNCYAPDDLIKKMLGKMNPCAYTDRWGVVNSKETAKGKHITFGIDEGQLAALKACKFRLHFGAGTAIFKDISKKVATNDAQENETEISEQSENLSDMEAESEKDENARKNATVATDTTDKGANSDAEMHDFSQDVSSNITDDKSGKVSEDTEMAHETACNK